MPAGKRKSLVLEEKARLVEQGGRVGYFSSRFRDFLDRVGHRPVLQRTKLIVEHSLPELLQGKVFEEGGIRVSRDWTGPEKGVVNNITLRVEAGGKSYFLKVSPCSSYTRANKVVGHVARLKGILEKGNNKINGLNIRLVEPILVVDTVQGGRKKTYYLGDFIEAEDNEQVACLRDNNIKNKISGVFKELEKKLGGSAGRFDHPLVGTNAFYNRKTNTLLLYGL